MRLQEEEDANPLKVRLKRQEETIQQLSESIALQTRNLQEERDERKKYQQKYIDSLSG